MWERGERIPRPKILQEICDYFNVDMDYLMGRSDIKNKYQAGLKYDWEDKLKQKTIQEDSKANLTGDFTITENIKGEYIRILNVSNDKTANERIYDLKTNKYSEKKINNIIISFCMENEDYTTEDTYNFIKLFKEYKKLSDDKQKEIDNIIYGKNKIDKYVEPLEFYKPIEKNNLKNILLEDKNFLKITSRPIKVKKKEFLGTSLFYDWVESFYDIPYYNHSLEIKRKNFDNIIKKAIQTYIVSLPESAVSDTENFLKENLPGAIVEKIDSDKLNSDTFEK